MRGLDALTCGHQGNRNWPRCWLGLDSYIPSLTGTFMLGMEVDNAVYV